MNIIEVLRKPSEFYPLIQLTIPPSDIKSILENDTNNIVD